LQEVPVEVLGLELVVSGKRMWLDLKVRLESGQVRVVHLSPRSARLLKGDEPGRLRDLQIGSGVVLGIHPDTGVVQLVRIAR
jgi:hypothetical protein